MADTEMSADTDTEMLAETDTETDNFRSMQAKVSRESVLSN
jgi:hypothetical protein